MGYKIAKRYAWRTSGSVEEERPAGERTSLEERGGALGSGGGGVNVTGSSLPGAGPRLLSGTLPPPANAQEDPGPVGGKVCAEVESGVGRQGWGAGRTLSLSPCPRHPVSGTLSRGTARPPGQRRGAGGVLGPEEARVEGWGTGRPNTATGTKCLGSALPRGPFPGPRSSCQGCAARRAAGTATRECAEGRPRLWGCAKRMV